MKTFFLFVSLALSLAASPDVNALSLIQSAGVAANTLGASGNVTCANEVITSEAFVGPNKDIKMTTSRCDDTPSELSTPKTNAVNVCDTVCRYQCYQPANSQATPTQRDCQVVADGMSFLSENFGDEIDSPANEFRRTLSFRTCTTSFINLADADLRFCYLTWADVVVSLGYNNCTPAKNAHGGICQYFAQSQDWAVQVEETSADDIAN